MSAIREQILVHIETTLRSVTTAAGYEVTFVNVERARLSPVNEEATPPWVWIFEGEENKTSSPLGYETADLSISIEAWTSKWQNPSTSVNAILASIQKAIAVDPTRGGKAIDTLETGNSFLYGDVGMEEIAGCMVNVTIKYRHKYGDPYSQ